MSIKSWDVSTIVSSVMSGVGEWSMSNWGNGMMSKWGYSVRVNSVSDMSSTGAGISMGGEVGSFGMGNFGGVELETMGIQGWDMVSLVSPWSGIAQMAS